MLGIKALKTLIQREKMATLADLLREGYVPPKESALADPIKEHFRTLPTQLAKNQAALDSAINSWNKTDFATGKLNPNYRPEAMAELTQLMPGIGGLTAWHGTPHKIQGAFDINKVGTGEGAQAYGHGMYFAENPNVARSYATTGSYETPADYASHYLAESKHDPKAAIKMLKEEAALFDKKGWDKADIPKEMIPQIEEALKKGEARSNLYKVDIPDEHIPNMLDWDKPYTQQPKGVKQLIDDAVQNENFDPFEYLALAGATKQHPRSKEYVPTGQEILNDLSALYGIERNSKEFSDLLQSHGIKGISYLDADSRTGKIASDGTKNFVVFDPSTVKILEENSKPVSRKELIEKQVKSLKE